MFCYLNKLTLAVLLVLGVSIRAAEKAEKSGNLMLASKSAEDNAQVAPIGPTGLGTDYCGRSWRSELSLSEEGDEIDRYMELTPLVEGFPLEAEDVIVTDKGEDQWLETVDSEDDHTLDAGRTPKGYMVCCPKAKRTHGGLKVKCPFNGGINVCKKCAKSTCNIGGGRKSACLKCAPCKRSSKGCDKRCCGVCAEAHGLDKRSLSSCMSGCGCRGHDRKCKACKRCKRPWTKECVACKHCACK